MPTRLWLMPLSELPIGRTEMDPRMQEQQAKQEQIDI